MTSCGGKSDIKLEIKPVGEIRGRFLIPSYQRGYRWTEHEVRMLLDDILEFYSRRTGNQKYCLQPMVVRRREDGQGSFFELIDGQQRLTTLFLILKFLDDCEHIPFNPPFTLDYETREKTERFLRNLSYSPQSGKIDDSGKEENIDFHFLAAAFHTIRDWFMEDLRSRRNRIGECLYSGNTSVNVIWYEVGGEVDSRELFTRLNIGKIPLTSSELVKALILSRDRRSEMTAERQQEIAFQWDHIEKELNRDDFWAFLSESGKMEARTRMELLLNLITGIEPGPRDDYAPFFAFSAIYDSPERMEDAWKCVREKFLQLRSWFEDHDFYHKIGYLIATGALSLLDICRLAEGKRKSEFKSILDGEIRKSLKFRRQYGELSYETDYREIMRLLLLFNVESVRRIEGGTRRFPFHLFKGKGVHKPVWSLEHIHARNSEDLKKEADWREWLESHRKVLEELSGEEAAPVDGRAAAYLAEMRSLCPDIGKLLEKKRITKEEFLEVSEKVVGLLSREGGLEYPHSIANLALLDTQTNTSLNNSVFAVKRRAIVEQDRKGAYIPFCTRMVFLGYYTEDGGSSCFWGPEERKGYIKAMNDILSEYLANPIVIGGE